MAFNGRKPELIETGKPKFMLSGGSGVGKTFFACEFPKVFYIDTEGGATRKQYAKKLIAGGGWFLGKEDGSQDYETVIRNVKALTNEKHEFKTLVIDSFSKLYNMAAAIAEESYGNDYGKDKKEANKPTRQLVLALEKIDMNVILICHGKAKWRKEGKEIVGDGTTYDGYDKLEFDLDLWLEMQMIGKQRFFFVKKTRIEEFPLGFTFPAKYEEFAKLYGKEIVEKDAEPIVLASKGDVEEVKQLIEVTNMDANTQKKWLEKSGVDSFEEMSQETIRKGINQLRERINKASASKSNKEEGK
jgi:hypothetical protein